MELFIIEDIKRMFEEIQSTNSTKKKQTILKEYENNTYFKYILHFLLNNYIVTGLSEKKINKNVSIIPNVNYKEFLGTSSNKTSKIGMIDLLEYIKENNTGKDIDISVCEMYFSNFNTEMQKFIKSILTKSLKLGIDAATVNKVYGKDFIPTWEVQQGMSIDKYKMKQDEWFSLSQKLNGIRATYIDGKLLSRQGKEINGLRHIISDISSIGMLQNYVIDGELVRKNTDNLSDNENFRIGTGIINSDTEDKSEIEFIVFDIIPKDEFLTGESVLTYKDRWSGLDLISKLFEECENLSVVETLYQGTDISMVDYYLDIMVKQDKEGLMLNRDTTYKCKRHNGILKVKRFYTMDLEVLDMKRVPAD